MKHTIALVITLLMLGVLLQDCSCSHLCPNPGAVAQFVGYDSTELDVVIVKQYQNNGQFSEVQRTAVYTSRKKNFFGADTSYLEPSGFIALEYFTDYMIEAPAAGKTWALKDLAARPARMKEKYCTSGFDYTLNNTHYNIPSSTGSSSAPAVVELKK